MGRDKFLQEIVILQALPKYDKEFSYMYSYVKDNREYFVRPDTGFNTSIVCDEDDLESREWDHRVFYNQEE